jgi:signal peptidase II
MQKGIRTKTFIIISALIIILDQISKQIVVSLLEKNESVFPANLLGNIVLTYNTGAGFGILRNWTGALGIISFLVATGIAVFYRHIKHEDRLFVALVLGGTIGNLIDRAFLGYVIDFLSISFWPPIFNIADSAITIGVLGLIINLIRKDIEIKILKNKKEGNKKKIKPRN